MKFCVVLVKIYPYCNHLCFFSNFKAALGDKFSERALGCLPDHENIEQSKNDDLVRPVMITTTLLGDSQKYGLKLKVAFKTA